MTRQRRVRISSGVGRPNIHQPFHVTKWEGMQKRGVYQAENGRVGADSQCNGEDRGGREARGFAQHAHAKAQILNQAVEQVDAAGFPALFLCAFYSAKLDARPPQRLLPRSATAHQILCERLDVEVQLRNHLPFHPRAPQQSAHPGYKPPPRLHTSSTLARKISGEAMLKPLGRVAALIRTSTPQWDPRASPAARGCK